MSKRPEDLIRESQERMRIVANCSVCGKGIRAWEYDRKDMCKDCWLSEFRASTKLIVDSIVTPPNANASSMTSSGGHIEKYCYACGNGIKRFEIEEDYAKSGRCFFCNQEVMQEFFSLRQRSLALSILVTRSSLQSKN